MMTLVNSCISKVDRIGMKGGKTESGREFQSFTSERVTILVNSCISKVDRIGMKGGKTESGREFQNLPMKE